MEYVQNDAKLQELYNKINQYEYGFENLAFEGGGAKLTAYVGAVQVLHSLGITEKCFRFAGTSGGGIIAAALACRMRMADIMDYVHVNMKERIIDSSFGKFSLLPNLLNKFGWNPGVKFLEFCQSMMEKATGNANITFMEVYKKFGTELCIVGTNISCMSVEYFHPKTTPNVEVATAMRITVALPGYLQPVRLFGEGNLEQIYLDGGLVCNFPVHVFDGWYLSMKFEDSYFHKLGSDEPPFGNFEPKTLGLLLYASGENEYMEGTLKSRYFDKVVERPKTKLSKERGKRCDEMLKTSKYKHSVMEAGQRFLKGLREVDHNKDAVISLEEFKHAWEKNSFQEEDCEILFGENSTIEKAFEELDMEDNDQISIEEFLLFMQKKGIRFRHLLEGGNMAHIGNFSDFFGVTFNTVLNTTRKAYFKQHDPDRTLGIYTDYIDTTDFDMAAEDKQFAVKQGVIGCLGYFEDILRKLEKNILCAEMRSVIKTKVAHPDPIGPSNSSSLDISSPGDTVDHKDIGILDVDNSLA